MQQTPQPHLNRIAFYRDRCQPPITQQTLAKLIGTSRQTIQTWENEGVPSERRLLQLVRVLVAHGAITDYTIALNFWQKSGKIVRSAPPELAELFIHKIKPETEQNEQHQPPPSCSLLPLLRNKLFVGRAIELITLNTELRTPDTTIVINAIAGMGKTQLAAEFAHRHGHSFPGGVFWISFADPDAVVDSIAICGISEHLSLGTDFEGLSLEKQVRRVQAAWRGATPRLLIFDNCEDESLLARWRPPIGGCRVLVTSRRAQWDASIVDRTLPLTVLNRGESVALLRIHCPHIPDQALDSVADELQDLPLALHLAGKYLSLHAPDLPASTYLAELRHAGSLPALDHPSLNGAGISPTQHHQHLARALAMTYQQLQPHEPVDHAAVQILARAAHFAPGEAIPGQLLLATAPPEMVPNAAAALRRLSGDLGLIERDKQNMFRLHRLVAAFAQTACNDSHAQNAVEQAMVAQANELSRSVDMVEMRSISIQHRYIADHALAHDSLLGPELGWHLGWHLTHLGELQTANQYMAQALASAGRIYGEQSAEWAQAVYRTGLLHQIRGNYLLAHEHFERSLPVLEQMLGINHPITTYASHALGYMLGLRGFYSEALTVLRLCLRVRQALFGLNDPNTARTANAIGYTLFQSRRFHAAQRYLKFALKMQTGITQTPHQATSQYMNCYGEMLHAWGRYEQALDYHLRALDMRLIVCGTTHIYTAESHKNVGAALTMLGRFEQAHQHLDTALAALRACSGEGAIDTAWCYERLGDWHRLQNDHNGANEPYCKALKVYIAQLAPDHPHIARIIGYNLAPCYNPP